MVKLQRGQKLSLLCDNATQTQKIKHVGTNVINKFLFGAIFLAQKVPLFLIDLI